MNKPKIYLSSPHMGGRERKYVDQAFEHNWIAPLGPNVSGLEEDLQTFLGDGVHVAALSSGTAALHLALILLGVREGDEVLCQSLTFAASANPIRYVGAIPVFIDSETTTLNLCPDVLEEAIKDRLEKGKKPKAIIAVHLYGMPYQVERVHQVARKYDIPVVEDSAEALGSSYNGQKCGTFGELAVLSFNGNKIITTSGGGALVSQTSREKQKAVFLATQARDNAPHYQHSEVGFNYRMSNISAGIGRGQMEVLDKHVHKRRENNKFYQQIFRSVSAVEILKEPDSTYFSNHWLSIARFDKGEKQLAEELRLHLANRNIESRPLWKPMHLQPVYHDYPYYGDEIASHAFERSICLPSGSNLTVEDKERISTAVDEFFS